MRKPLTIFGIFLLVIFLFFLGQYLYYYPGKYQPLLTKRPAFEEISYPQAEIKLFSDVYKERKGQVLLDLAHDNDFQLEEFYLPTLRITSRGYSLEYLKKNKDLEEKLRFVDSFIIILPQADFPKEEVKLIKDFLKKGGKLLLIADPTRPSQINKLATQFGIIFENDYLYNLKENDGNFRYIYLKNFKSDSEITKNLEKITFYGAGSISPSEWGIVFADENTLSSITETKETFSPVLLSPDSRVLAISDFTFLVEPYNLSTDNNQFIANLADWLTKSERTFYLADFPYFFFEQVKITYASANYLDSGLKLKNFFKDLEINSDLAQYEKNLSGDLIFLGLFDEAEKIKDFLKKGKIEIAKEKIKIEGVGEIDKKGTSIFYLNKTGQDTLIILSDKKERLGETVEKLISGQFRDWLVTDILGLYHIEVEEEEEKEE